MKKLFWAMGVLLFASACISFSQHRDPADSKKRPSICVVNESIYDYKVYVNEYRLGLVTGGQTKVLYVPRTMGNREVRIRAIAMDTGRDVHLWPLTLGGHLYWKWTIGNLPSMSKAGFNPSPGNCK